MKKGLWLLFTLIPVFNLSSYPSGSNKIVFVKEVVINESILSLDSLIVLKDSITLDSLKSLIAYRESGGLKSPYSVTNKYGMLGKYQFSPKTLVRLGYSQTDIKKFLVTEIDSIKVLEAKALQESAMIKLLNSNYSYIKNYNLLPYIGKKVGGVKITLSGLLAGSHLVGVASVNHYVKNKGSMAEVVLKTKFGKVTLRKIDANGTTIKEYLSILD